MSARRFLAVVALLATLTACSSTTKGAGTHPSAAPSTTSSARASTSHSSAAPPASATSSAAPSSPAVPVHPVPSKPLRTATVHAATATFVINVWAETTVPDCLAHAYGSAMLAFLTAHPCRGLDRILATTTVGGRPVGFNVSSTSFAGTADQPYDGTAKFRALVEAEGTGSLNDLLREGYRLPSGPTSVPAGEAFTTVGQDSGVSVYDIWYLSGTTPDNDPALVAMAHDIYLQY